MTPKEKAKELVDKFINYSYFSDGNNFMNRQYQREDNAKQCALIAVDEIIETFIPKHNRTYLCEEIEFWQQVKTEIQLL